MYLFLIYKYHYPKCIITQAIAPKNLSNLAYIFSFSFIFLQIQHGIKAVPSSMICTVPFSWKIGTPLLSKLWISCHQSHGSFSTCFTFIFVLLLVMNHFDHYCASFQRFLRLLLLSPMNFPVTLAKPSWLFFNFKVSFWISYIFPYCLRFPYVLGI